MAFIYEVNGQRVEFDREPTDADIDEAARSLGAPTSAPITQPEPALSDVAVNQAGISAVRPALGMAASQVGDAAKLARIAGQVTPNIVGEFLSTPIKSAKDLTAAYLAGHPMAGAALNTPLKAMPGAVMRGVGAAVAAPESAFLMPYNMAAYEQEKIRANPNAPGLQYNPYAQTVRGEVAPVGNRPTSPQYLGDATGSGMFTRQNVGTQAQAGEGNRMRALANMSYGNVSAQERAMLDEDARMRQNIRKKAYEKVMGPVVPGTF